jgi:hypothetical protein
VVRLVDYFSKLDETKICKLKIIVRRMGEVAERSDLLGSPQDIQQYMLNSKKALPKQEGVKKVVKEAENNLGRSEECSIKL